MLNFKDFLKVMLPPGELWVPVEAEERCPEPDFDDGDMEAVGIGDWLAGNSATLTKNLTAPHAGLQFLQIDFNGTSKPYAYQNSLTLGCQYRLIGWTKRDVANPVINSVWNGTTVLWSQTLIDANWLQFDITFTATAADLRFGSDATAESGAWVGFDDCTLTLIRKETTAHFDLTLAAIGELQETTVYEFLKDLAYIRDPYKTPYLSDLEKEYGLVTDLTLTESERRAQVAAIKYAPRGSGSWDDMEQILVTAGLPVEIRTNDPAVSPELPNLASHELIVNGIDLDKWINYLAGLPDQERWPFLFWIVATSEGWPYEYGSMIHSLKNSGALSYYNDYFTRSIVDYSKFRYESVVESNVTFDDTGADFGTAGSITITNAPRFDNTEGCLLFSSQFISQVNGERLYSKRDASDHSLEVYLLTGPERIAIADESAVRTINYSLPGILPTSLGINFKDGQVPTLWANGGLVGSFSGALNMSQYDQPTFIGNDYTLANPSSNTIETMLQFNRELTAAEFSALHTNLAALTAPDVTYPVLTMSQKAILINLVAKFKPMGTIGLLAVASNNFTFTNPAGYPGNGSLGFSSLTAMDGGRLITPEEF